MSKLAAVLLLVGCSSQPSRSATVANKVPAPGASGGEICKPTEVCHNVGSSDGPVPMCFTPCGTDRRCAPGKACREASEGVGDICVDGSDPEHCGAAACQPPEQCLDAAGQRACYVPCGPERPCEAGKCTSRDGFVNVCFVP